MYHYVKYVVFGTCNQDSLFFNHWLSSWLSILCISLSVNSTKIISRAIVHSGRYHTSYGTLSCMPFLACPVLESKTHGERASRQRVVKVRRRSLCYEWTGILTRPTGTVPSTGRYPGTWYDTRTGSYSYFLSVCYLLIGYPRESLWPHQTGRSFWWVENKYNWSKSYRYWAVTRSRAWVSAGTVLTRGIVTCNLRYLKNRRTTRTGSYYDLSRDYQVQYTGWTRWPT